MRRGGGVPDGAGPLTGVEAVVDKDLTAAALAVTMAADRMLLRACGRFPSSTGHPSSIAALTDAAAVLSGAAGTTITPDRAAGSRAPVGAGAACRP